MAVIDIYRKQAIYIIEGSEAEAVNSSDYISVIIIASNDLIEMG